MSWLILLAAGLVEVAWSQSIKPTDGFTKPGQTLLCVLIGATSVYLLSRAMRDLPPGLSYAVFTGIGTVGAIALGVTVHDEPANFGKVAALTLIVAGLVLARVTSAS